MVSTLCISEEVEDLSTALMTQETIQLLMYKFKSEARETLDLLEVSFVVVTDGLIE